MNLAVLDWWTARVASVRCWNVHWIAWWIVSKVLIVRFCMARRLKLARYKIHRLPSFYDRVGNPTCISSSHYYYTYLYLIERNWKDGENRMGSLYSSCCNLGLCFSTLLHCRPDFEISDSFSSSWHFIIFILAHVHIPFLLQSSSSSTRSSGECFLAFRNFLRLLTFISSRITFSGVMAQHNLPSHPDKKFKSSLEMYQMMVYSGFDPLAILKDSFQHLLKCWKLF